MIEAVVSQMQHDPRFWQSIGVGDISSEFEQRQAALINAVLGLDAAAFVAHVESLRESRI